MEICSVSTLPPNPLAFRLSQNAGSHNNVESNKETSRVNGRFQRDNTVREIKASNLSPSLGPKTLISPVAEMPSLQPPVPRQSTVSQGPKSVSASLLTATEIYTSHVNIRVPISGIQARVPFGSRARRMTISRTIEVMETGLRLPMPVLSTIRSGHFIQRMVMYDSLSFPTLSSCL